MKLLVIKHNMHCRLFKVIFTLRVLSIQMNFRPQFQIPASFVTKASQERLNCILMSKILTSFPRKKEVYKKLDMLNFAKKVSGILVRFAPGVSKQILGYKLTDATLMKAKNHLKI